MCRANQSEFSSTVILLTVPLCLVEYKELAISRRIIKNDSYYRMEQERDKEFLEFVVKELVDHPESVQVNRTVDQMGVLLTLDVHAEDMGKIIGRSGATAKAVRTLLRVVGMKNNARVNLKINEPEGGLRSEQYAGAQRDTPATAPQQPSGPDHTALSKTVDEAMEELKL